MMWKVVCDILRENSGYKADRSQSALHTYTHITHAQPPSSVCTYIGKVP